MKPIMPVRLFVFAAALLGAAVVSLQATDPKTPVPPPPDLQIAINVPPTWRPFLDDDIAEVFGDQADTVFHRGGYQGVIVTLKRLDEPSPRIALLEINLVEWRIGRTGTAECTFSASLRTAAGTKDLGLIAETAMFWPRGGGHWGLGRLDQRDALDNAAGAALKSLYRRVADTGLIPGLAVKK